MIQFCRNRKYERTKAFGYQRSIEVIKIKNMHLNSYPINQDHNHSSSDNRKRDSKLRFYQNYVFNPLGKLQFLLKMLLETSLFSNYKNESKSVILVVEKSPLYERIQVKISSKWIKMKYLSEKRVKNKGWKITLNQFIKHHVYEHIYKKEGLY